MIIKAVWTLCLLCLTLPVLAEPQFLETGGGRIAYEDGGGTGPMIVAIPGIGDLRGEYRLLAPLLTAAGYRVVTFDIRGMGDSSPNWTDISAHAAGRDALALMAHLGAPTATLIGTSFAAGAVLWAAHDAPAMVKAKILIGPSVRDVKLGFLGRTALTLSFLGPWDVGLWSWYWDSLFTLRRPPDHDAYRAALEDNLRQPGRTKALEAMLRLGKADTESILQPGGAPALVIMGTADPDFSDPKSEAEALALQIGASPFLVDGVGHYPQVEAPEKVAARIIEFLRTAP